MSIMAWTAVILAAGKGTRMASCKPKALQMLAGRTLIGHVLNTLDNLSIDVDDECIDFNFAFIDC